MKTNKIILLIVTVITIFSNLHGKNISFVSDTVKFVCTELLGCPTDKSVTINLCAEENISIFIEYGEQQNNLINKTAIISLKAFIPANITIDKLFPGRKYYYRLSYKKETGSEYIKREIYSFSTQKNTSQTFSFAIEADPHLDYNTIPELYRLTLKNISTHNPDFLIDLGDTFMSEKEPNVNESIVLQRHLLFRDYFDSVCHSVPLFFVLGNHEGETGRWLNGTANNLAVWATNTRKLYYPNPESDDFYSGNSKEEEFVGLRQNYYSWEWGNALFVVLDPYWYSNSQQAKEKGNWYKTLGSDQYLWFKKVLETSRAKFKFVFMHQVIGGKDNDGRGGIEVVPYFEMGGKNLDGSWGFDINRPGWELPLHQLMVKNGVSIFFHGHDHIYAKQELDGIIYQEIPQPGNPNFNNNGPAEEYGYINGVILPNTGFLKVTVSDNEATVDYIRSFLPDKESATRKNNSVLYSYTVKPGNVTNNESVIEIPQQFELKQNYPNPFGNGSVERKLNTTIEYILSEAGNVSLKVFDVLGREVAALFNGYQDAGIHYAVLQLNDYNPASGIYYYRLTAGGQSVTKKMIYLK